ncbi:hypothetical protein ACLGL1_06930 [Peptococcus simiae]|uniref:hypothetical protein n=1 Tax=Peptococcus simiae TaxID=1643805 RepID=UPI0039818F75
MEIKNKTLEKVIAMDSDGEILLQVEISFDKYNTLNVEYYIYRMEAYSYQELYENIIEELERIGVIEDAATYVPLSDEFIWPRSVSVEEMQEFIFDGMESIGMESMKAYYYPPFYPTFLDSGSKLEPAHYIDNLSPEVEVLISLCKRHQGKELSDSLAGFIRYWFEELEEISPEDVVAAQ